MAKLAKDEKETLQHLGECLLQYMAMSEDDTFPEIKLVFKTWAAKTRLILAIEKALPIRDKLGVD